MNETAVSPRPKLPLIAATIVVATAFLLAYYPTLLGLVRAWGASEENSHGFLIVPVAAYLVWCRREVLELKRARSSWWGLLPVLVALSIYIVSRKAGINTAASVTVILFVAGMLWLLWGWRTLWELAFPVVFLLFMIPVPTQIYSALTIPLQLFVSNVATHIAQGVGVPLFREGNVLHLPGHTLQVVQACSGLRSMTALLCMSALVSHLSLKGPFLQGLLFVIGIPVAVAVNVFRVSALILAFHYLGYDLTEGTAHTLLGLGVFLSALALLLAMKEVLAWVDARCARRS